MPNITAGQRYPFDPTGKAATNKITNEYHVITAANWRSYHFIVPKKGPFFSDSVDMVYRNTENTIVPLKEGIDFVYGYWYLGASRACAKNVYGAIVFLNTKLQGNIQLRSYQSIGGEWVADPEQLTTAIGNYLHNPLTTTWEVIANVPTIFPPEPHDWNLVDMVGAKDLNDSIQEIVALLRTQSSEGLGAHLADFNNPHKLTKAQIQLGNVANLPLLPISGQAANNTNNFYLTPLTARQIIAHEVKDAFLTFVARRDNPHGVTAAQVDAFTKAQINALLQNKLSLTDIAFDAARFGGLTPQEFIALAMQSTSANALLFDGRSYSDMIDEIAQITTANDTFGGRTPNAYRDWVLTFTAANAGKFNNRDETQYMTWLSQNDDFSAKQFDGKTFDEAKAEILSGKAADSQMLDGKTYAELKSDLSASLGGNATHLEGKTLTEIKQEIINTTVFGATQAYGLDLDALKVEILKGTAANSMKLQGKTFNEVKVAVLEGKAADTNLFDGKTLDQVIAMAQISGGSGGNASTFGGYTVDQFFNEVYNRGVKNANTVESYTVQEIVTRAKKEASLSSIPIRHLGKANGLVPAGLFKICKLKLNRNDGEAKDFAFTIRGLFDMQIDINVIVSLYDLLSVNTDSQKEAVEIIPTRLFAGVAGKSGYDLFETKDRFEEVLKGLIGIYALREEIVGNLDEWTFYLKLESSNVDREMSVVYTSVNERYIDIQYENVIPVEVGLDVNDLIKMNITGPKLLGNYGTYVNKEYVNDEIGKVKSEIAISGSNTTNELKEYTDTKIAQSETTANGIFVTKTDLATTNSNLTQLGNRIAENGLGEKVKAVLLDSANKGILNLNQATSFHLTTTSDVSMLTIDLKPKNLTGSTVLPSNNGDSVLQHATLILKYDHETLISWMNGKFVGGSAPVFQVGKRYMIGVVGLISWPDNDQFSSLLYNVVGEI